MKNYIAVSILYDKIVSELLFYKVAATNPALPDSARIDIQRKLAKVLQLIDRVFVDDKLSF